MSPARVSRPSGRGSSNWQDQGDQHRSYLWPPWMSNGSQFANRSCLSLSPPHSVFLLYGKIVDRKDLSELLREPFDVPFLPSSSSLITEVFDFLYFDVSTFFSPFSSILEAGRISLAFGQSCQINEKMELGHDLYVHLRTALYIFSARTKEKKKEKQGELLVMLIVLEPVDRSSSAKTTSLHFSCHGQRKDCLL